VPPTVVVVVGNSGLALLVELAKFGCVGDFLFAGAEGDRERVEIDLPDGPGMYSVPLLPSD
jgi:hypothetical protein